MADPRKDAEADNLTYATAGVDIAAGEALVDQVKPYATSTRRPGSEAHLGGFGGLFDPKAAGFQDPILVAGTDGVGTKLRVAIDTDRLDDLGQDLVAMCANDVLAQGAEPLFFLDYFATGKLDPDRAARVIKGVAEGCRQAGCALIGGETAEMPGLYHGADFDLAGFVVGAAERGDILPKTAQMRVGDVLIALPGSGPHANGFSLIRTIVDRAALAWTDPAPFAPTRSLADVMLAPTPIYVRPLLPLIRQGLVKGLAHITGGGLVENPPRMTPPHLRPRIDFTAWERPALFSWLKLMGSLEEAELRRTFNCGVGMVVCAAPEQTDPVLEGLSARGIKAFVCGDLVEA
ncbi:MAG: phosphoribosylformylglycinamidine cyclo-ligase [Maricaulaceae bacterium]